MGCTHIIEKRKACTQERECRSSYSHMHDYSKRFKPKPLQRELSQNTKPLAHGTPLPFLVAFANSLCARSSAYR